MDIQIKNLGPIKTASINLDKKLILFCGANGTGKTYLSYIIYALTSEINFDSRISFTQEQINDLRLNKAIEFSINIDTLRRFSEKLCSEIKSDIDTIFGLSEEVSKNLFKGFDISLTSLNSELEKRINNIGYKIELNIAKAKFELNKETNSDNVTLKPDSENDFGSERNDFLFTLIPSLIYKAIISAPLHRAVILPVERNSIYTFNKELSISRNELIDRIQDLPKKGSIDLPFFIAQRSKRYPQAIKDGLSVANDLTTIQKTKSLYFDIAQEIESQLLDGTLAIGRDGDVKFTSNKATKNKSLPIHMTASLVKTLSSLIFYLKYQAQKNDLIIIDEPEMNLHPNNQVLLVKLFGKLINNGLRLLVSTHSDYIIREVNNLIMAASEKEGVKEIAEELGYSQDIKLSGNDVGVYYFVYRKNSKTAEVTEIEVEEDGFTIQSIDDTIEIQNNITEKLSGAISYGTY